MCVSASLILLCYLLCPLHTQTGGKCIASLTELVGLGPCLPPPSLPDGQHFGPHREREVVSGGDDETLLARHTPQLTPNRRLDCSSPQTWRDVLLMLMASPVSQLICRDSLRLRLTRTDRAVKKVAEAEQFKFCFVVTVFNIFT